LDHAHRTEATGQRDPQLGRGERIETHAVERVVGDREIAGMIAVQPCRLLAASASNALSLGPADTAGRLAADPEVWEQFLNWEEELAQEPGMLDGGTHILFAIERSQWGNRP
jgi:hypothetical protein